MTIKVTISNDEMPGGKSLQVISVHGPKREELTGLILEPGERLVKYLHEGLEFRIVEIP